MTARVPYRQLDLATSELREQFNLWEPISDPLCKFFMTRHANLLWIVTK